MGFDYTTTNLIADISRKCFIPTSQVTFSIPDLLAMADEELQIGVVPLVMRTREEYFVAYKDTTITGTENGFDLPPRAIGGVLREVTIIQNPDSADTPNERKIPQLAAEDAPYNNNFNNFLGLQSFYLRNNQVILSPNASAFGGGILLRQYYFLRPNKLVQVNQTSQIVSITNNVATVNVIPAGFGSGLFQISSDVVKSIPGFGLLAMDETVTCNTTDLTITFTNNLSTYGSNGIQVGDYICLAGETPIPQIPVELHTLLAQRTAVKILESLGDEKNLPAAAKKLQEMETNITGLISSRVQGNAKKIVNNYSVLNKPFRRY